MKLSPFRSALSLQNEIDRLFNEWPSQNAQNGWYPAVDVHERDDVFLVTAELPGVKLEDVKISLNNNVLSVSGTKDKPREEDQEHYFRIERVYGSFERSFKLPTTIDPDKIVAKYEDGILKITLPKAEEAKPREIPIATS